MNEYYRNELNALHERGIQMAEKYPALASMLDGKGTDPDVERLLQGTAFFTSMLKQKLDDEYPELIHQFMRLLFPHYLRPLPSSTIVTFEPQEIDAKRLLVIPKGTTLSSVPVEGTQCLFKTCFDVDLQPINIQQADIEIYQNNPMLKLTFQILNAKLSDWKPSKLRLHLTGDYNNATDLFLLLNNHLKQIRFSTGNHDNDVIVSNKHLHYVGFEETESLIPFPSNAYPGFRILQEYFFFPEKFLFVDILGWDQFEDKGSGKTFDLCFVFDRLPKHLNRLNQNHFCLNATPAINLFPHDADPIRLDHFQTSYPVQASGTDKAHYQIYSIEEVTGFIHGTSKKRVYKTIDETGSDPTKNPIYHPHIQKNEELNRIDYQLSVVYQKGDPPAPETLSIKTLCTNGFLAEQLKVNDIQSITDRLPFFVTVRNICAPNQTLLPPLTSDLLWRLLSHININHVPLTNAQSLRELLQLYVFETGYNRKSEQISKKRINGIANVCAKPKHRIISGALFHGQHIELETSEDHFSSEGDLFLFGCVLHDFFADYVSMNNFTSLTIKKMIHGDEFKWQSKFGNRYMI
jgi:type VI secretion system protein ImpG